MGNAIFRKGKKTRRNRHDSIIPPGRGNPDIFYLAWIGILVQWQLQEQEIGREVSFIFGTTRQRLCCKMISLAGARDSMSFPPMTDVVYGRYTTLLSPAYTWIDRRWWMWIYTGRRRRRGKSRVACENSLLTQRKTDANVAYRTVV
jgi:hypothetical protein